MARRFILGLVPDVLFIWFMGWMLPEISGRLRLFDHFPGTSYFLAFLCVALAIVEPFAILYLLKHLLANQPKEQKSLPKNRALMLLGFLRVFPILLPLIALVGGAFGKIWVGMAFGAIGAISSMFYASAFSGSSELIRPKKLEPACLFLVHSALFVSMSCFSVLGFYLLSQLGDLDILGVILSHPLEAAGKLILIFVFYFPVRLYELIEEGMHFREGLSRLLYALKVLVVFLIIAHEVSTTKVPTLEVALDRITDKSRVQSLNLENSDLTRINELDQFPNLVEISLTNNRLTETPPVIWSLKSLLSLDLSHNELQHLPSDISKLFRLEKLRLLNNGLNSLPIELLSMGLEQLDVSRNPLNQLDERFKVFFDTKPGWRR
ncbi:MAG: leucine-rich repeat domain-containing protein [Spirochaetota bacterium]